MIRLIVKVGGDNPFDLKKKLDTGFRVFEINNPAFEELLQSEGEMSLIGLEVVEGVAGFVPEPHPNHHDDTWRGSGDQEPQSLDEVRETLKGLQEPEYEMPINWNPEVKQASSPAVLQPTTATTPLTPANTATQQAALKERLLAKRNRRGWWPRWLKRPDLLAKSGNVKALPLPK